MSYLYDKHGSNKRDCSCPGIVTWFSELQFISREKGGKSILVPHSTTSCIYGELRGDKCSYWFHVFAPRASSRQERCVWCEPGQYMQSSHTELMPSTMAGYWRTGAFFDSPTRWYRHIRGEERKKAREKKLRLIVSASGLFPLAGCFPPCMHLTSVCVPTAVVIVRESQKHY